MHKGASHLICTMPLPTSASPLLWDCPPEGGRGLRDWMWHGAALKGAARDTGQQSRQHAVFSRTHAGPPRIQCSVEPLQATVSAYYSEPGVQETPPSLRTPVWLGRECRLACLFMQSHCHLLSQPPEFLFHSGAGSPRLLLLFFLQHGFLKNICNSKAYLSSPETSRNQNSLFWKSVGMIAVLLSVLDYSFTKCHSQRTG